MSITNSTSSAVFRWRPACWLRVTGEDAANFLQGQFTNDLRPLAGSGCVYGLWLTLKGKVLADSFVLRRVGGSEFWIGSYFSPAAVIRERIESHVIADDVVVEDVTADWAGISLLGGSGADLLANVAGKPMPPGPALVFPGRRDRSGGVECVYPVAGGVPGAIEALAQGAPEIGAEELARRRIEAAIPAVPGDVGPSDLPNEAGLEADAISYTKGCYLGQEVMARLKSMGQVRRRLLRVRGSGREVPALPAAVFVGERQAGELRSAAQDGTGGWIGLAMLSLLHAKPDTPLAFASGGPPALRREGAP